MKKKRRLSRRILPVLLSCAMVLQTLAGIAPQTVHAANDTLHCINPWTGYGNMPVTKGDGTVVYHPQVTYGNDANGAPRAVFCIDLGAALSSGDEYTLYDPDTYTELNERQKLAIAYATGNGAVTQPYADPVTGFAGAASTAEAQATLQKFWSTQLMIWYFVEKYDDSTVDKGGLDWAGVEATCNSGWGDLTECNRIWDYVYNMMEKPTFTEWWNGGATATDSYPQIRLDYDSASGTYIGWAQNTDTYVSIVDGNYYVEDTAINNALSFTVTDDAGNPNDNGNWLKITSTMPIAESTDTIVWGQKTGDKGICSYVNNITSPQDNVEVHSVYPASPDYFGFRVYTEGGTGEFSMNKVGLDSSYFAGNANYTVAGAVYTLEMMNGTNAVSVATLVTDTDGTGHVTYNSFDTANVCSGTVTTADTHTVVTGLPYGSYRVRETQAPKGYALDPTMHTFTLDSSNVTTRQTWTSNEKAVAPLLTMTKVSTNTSMTAGNSCYSLAGATYQVYTDPACTTPATALLVDANGRITGTTNAVLTTDANGNANTLYMPVGTYYVKETVASKGFRLDNEPHRVIVTENNVSTPATFESNEMPLNDPAVIQIDKVDSESITMIKNGQAEPEVIGGASLEGAVFEVKYYGDYYDSVSALTGKTAERKWYIQTLYDEITNTFRAGLDVEHLASNYRSDAFYYDGGVTTLPLGTYTMQEVKAPDGYTLDGNGTVMTNAAGVVADDVFIGQVRIDPSNPGRAQTYVRGAGDSTFETNQEGEPVRVFTTLQNGSSVGLTNEIKRGDFTFVKEDYESGETMEGVFFRITSSTGESHVVKTGENGLYKSSTDSIPHTQNTNAYDLLFDNDPSNDYINGTYIGDMECGLWFFGTDNENEWNNANIDNDRGACRYDESYTVKELVCPANKGKQLMLPRTFQITEEGTTVNLGSYSNVPGPFMHTLEWDTLTGTHMSVSAEGVMNSITDTITMEYLTAGKTYTTKGILMELNEDGTLAGPLLDANGNYIRANKTFTVEDTFNNTEQEKNMTVDVVYEFDGSNCSGKTFVIFEYLFEGRDDTPIPVLPDDTIDETGVYEGQEGVPVKHTDETDDSQIGYFRQQGRVQILKTGPFISGTTKFTAKLPDGTTKEITRLSYEQKPFAGITFTVFDAKTDKAVTSFTTDAEGKAVSDILLFGGDEEYYVMETDTPAGLVQSTEKIPVVFSEYNEEEDVYETPLTTITNDVTGARINVYKKGEFIIPNTENAYGVAQKGIEGVYFGVYANEDIKDNAGNVVITKGTLVSIAKTNEEGLASVCESLVAGKYYFEEIMTATDEYELDSTRFDFTIAYKRNTTEPEVVFDVNAENPLLNKFKTQNAEILKTDDEGKPLAGVQFALYRKYKDEYIQIGSYTTGKDGKISITNIPYGEYYWIETKGLDGYVYDGTTKYTFTVDDSGTENGVISVHAVNTKTPKTGDNSPLGMVFLIMGTAVLGLSVVMVSFFRKKKRCVRK